METIPTIISSLTNEQFEKLLGICMKQEFPIYTEIFKEGQLSSNMYILTDGVLKVTLRGKELNRIFPISTVGEMGVLTGEPRSATVISMSECTLLMIMRNELLDLFEKDKDFQIQFQRGMLLDMANKLQTTNEVIADLRMKLENKL